jgi:hypothetical protein
MTVVGPERRRAISRPVNQLLPHPAIEKHNLRHHALSLAFSGSQSGASPRTRAGRRSP